MLPQYSDDSRVTLTRNLNGLVWQHTAKRILATFRFWCRDWHPLLYCVNWGRLLLFLCGDHSRFHIFFQTPVCVGVVRQPCRCLIHCGGELGRVGWYLSASAFCHFSVYGGCLVVNIHHLNDIQYNLYLQGHETTVFPPCSKRGTTLLPAFKLNNHWVKLLLRCWGG